MKARRKRVARAKAAPPVAPPGPVYPAESDPRQVKADEPTSEIVRLVADGHDLSAVLATEFGRWTRAGDGSWVRKGRG